MYLPYTRYNSNDFWYYLFFTTIYPIINVISKNKENTFWYILKNFTDIGYGICTYPDNIASYLENLNRLGLIEIPKGEYVANETLYDKLKQHKRITEIIAKPLPKNLVYDFQKYKFNLTNFGINFIKACVVDTKQSNI